MIKTAIKMGAFSVLSLISVSAIAETPSASIKLAAVSGDVMVNNGKSFIKANTNADIKPGTKLITKNNSTANLVYKNGCVKKVKPNTILTVGSQNECVAGKFTDEKIHVAAVGDTVILEDGRSGLVTKEEATDGKFFQVVKVVSAVGVASWLIYELTDGKGGSNRVLVETSPGEPT